MRKIMMLFVGLTAFATVAEAETVQAEKAGAAVESSLDAAVKKNLETAAKESLEAAAKENLETEVKKNLENAAKEGSEAVAKNTEPKILFKKVQDQINMPTKVVTVTDEWKQQKEAVKQNSDAPNGLNNGAADLQFSLKKSDNKEDITTKGEDKATINPFAPVNWSVNKQEKTDTDGVVKTETDQNQQKKVDGKKENAAKAKEDKVKPVITRTIVIQSPEEKIRPVVFEDHVYAANSYTCGERKGLKFCENYKGSGLTGEIEQTYGDFVAHEKYRRGYLHGEITFISVDGQLIRRTNYKNGRKHGREFNYHKNGNIDFIVNYKEGVLNGLTEQYALNGQKIGQMVYRNGKLHKRSCRQETQDEVLLAKLKEKNYNELILCADVDDLSE